MPHVNPCNRTFLLPLLFWLLILSACTKSGDPTTPKPQNPVSPTVKSWVVTYPFYTSNETLFYNIQHDSITNTFTIHILDSENIFEGIYARIWTRKTYYLTDTKPQRVSKISVRRWQQNPQTGPFETDENYDFAYQYNDEGFTPSHITITLYSDTAGLVLLGRADQDVSNPVVNWSYEAGEGDLLNWKYALPQRSPLKQISAGCCFIQQYTDSSFELQNNTNDFSYTLFYNLQDAAPVSQPATGDEAGLYIFNKNHFLSTMAMDILSSKDYPSTLPIALSGFLLRYQRKFDFNYTSQQPGVYSIFNVTGIPEAIYWEQACQYTTGIYARWCKPMAFTYYTIDPYIAEYHQFYQDICDSYTDSLFTKNDSPDKILVSHAKYFNSVVMNGDTVSRIVKTDEAGHILRNIELKY